MNAQEIYNKRYNIEQLEENLTINKLPSWDFLQDSKPIIAQKYANTRIKIYIASVERDNHNYTSTMDDID
jgi:hypothetical protein